MESALNKAGLYEMIGVLLSGMTVVMTSIYLGSPIIKIEHIDNDVLRICAFLIASYLIGIALQEGGIWLDPKLLKDTRNILFSYLNDRRVFIDPIELSEVRTLADRILGKPEDNTEFSKWDNHYVFYYCKRYLEVAGKDGKAEKFESLGDMSRSLMIAMPLLIVCHIIVALAQGGAISWWKIAVLGAFTFIFRRRVDKYTRFRISTILRHYQAITSRRKC